MPILAGGCLLSQLLKSCALGGLFIVILVKLLNAVNAVNVGLAYFKSMTSKYLNVIFTYKL